jgi:hypothetical protein
VLEEAYPLDLSFLIQLRSGRTTRGHFDGLSLAAERGDQQRGGCERGSARDTVAATAPAPGLPTRLTLL